MQQSMEVFEEDIHRLMHQWDVCLNAHWTIFNSCIPPPKKMLTQFSFDRTSYNSAWKKVKTECDNESNLSKILLVDCWSELWRQNNCTYICLSKVSCSATGSLVRIFARALAQGMCKHGYFLPGGISFVLAEPKQYRTKGTRTVFRWFSMQCSRRWTRCHQVFNFSQDMISVLALFGCNGCTSKRTERWTVSLGTCDINKIHML